MTKKKSFILNSGFSVLSQLALLIGRFLLRSAFIRILGIEILGYNSTFGNILSMLNLSELGIGVAITYRLYKPFSENDYSTISNYLYIYKRFYFYIAIIISVFGCCLCPLLPLITKSPQSQTLFLTELFLLQLARTVATYVASYTKVILNVQEKNYIINSAELISNIMTIIFQYIAIVYLKNYYLYLVIDILGALISNLITYRCVVSRYNFILNIIPQKTSVRILAKDVVKSVRDIIVAKIGSYVLNATDYLVISSLLGVVYSGLLSNYNIVFQNFQSLILVAMNSVQSIIGNALYSTDKKNVLKLINQYTIILTIISAMFCPVANSLMDDFLKIWIGNQYVMEPGISLLLSLNVMLMFLSSPISLLFGSLGYFNYDKYIVMISAITNVVLSIILCKTIGVRGVLIGTTISIMIYWVSRVIILKQHYFGDVRRYKFTVAISIVCLSLSYFLTPIIDAGFPCNSILEFINKGIIMELPISVICLFEYFFVFRKAI